MAADPRLYAGTFGRWGSNMDHVVVDVEIAHTVEETPGGWDATDKLGVAVACLWECRTQRMRVYGPDDVQALRERLLSADRISGYNIWNFDFPVIWAVPKPDWIDPSRLSSPGLAAQVRVKESLEAKTNDILRRIWQAQGFNPDRWQAGMGNAKLDDIAGATIGVRKIGNGADAPRWFQAGLVQRVANYCADDVAIERDLAEFVDRYGYVIHRGERLLLKP
jgi:DEAD/DEAH box helicase domain-containing protein